MNHTIERETQKDKMSNFFVWHVFKHMFGDLIDTPKGPLVPVDEAVRSPAHGLLKRKGALKTTPVDKGQLEVCELC